jgi:hypothetical protein
VHSIGCMLVICKSQNESCTDLFPHQRCYHQKQLSKFNQSYIHFTRLVGVIPTINDFVMNVSSKYLRSSISHQHLHHSHHLSSTINKTLNVVGKTTTVTRTTTTTRRTIFHATSRTMSSSNTTSKSSSTLTSTPQHDQEPNAQSPTTISTTDPEQTPVSTSTSTSTSAPKLLALPSAEHSSQSQEQRSSSSSSSSSSAKTGTTQLQVGGQGVKLDHLGPMVVNRDGTLSRIANWAQMSEGERGNAVRILGRRNQVRLEELREGEGMAGEEAKSASD